MNQFYVYIYRRPDGSPFYVGKGIRRRALSLSPSRRSPHFMNIIRKYGSKAVFVEMIPCESEYLAFSLERQLISSYREQRMVLSNMTDGGEGCAGRPMSEKTREAFESWHGAYHLLSSSAKQAILKGLERGRESSKAWRESEAGVAHLKRLVIAGSIALHRPRQITCCSCGRTVTTTCAKAKSCSRLCEQRHRRLRKPVTSRKVYASNTSGVTGVYRSGNGGKWIALVSEQGNLRSCGTFHGFLDAVCARKSWEANNPFFAVHHRRAS